MADQGWDDAVVESEFASVSLHIERTINGARLIVQSRSSERSIALDALELEGLTACGEPYLNWLVNPARFTDGPAGSSGPAQVTPDDR